MQKNYMSNKYNTTQLNPEQTFEKHVFHRDQFAHYLRWTHVLKTARIGMKILDVGCGSGNLYEVFYRNKYSPERFVGVDIRKKTIEKNKEKFKNAEWFSLDIVNEALPIDDYDIITSFEVIEHIGKDNAEKYINNIKKVMKNKTIFMLSTPCYDEKIGAANNHIINGVVCEFEFNELKNILNKHFIIDNVYGTFASQKDYKDKMNDWQKQMFENLSSYYDSNLISNIMAPMFPEYSRNCLWVLKIK